MILALKNISKTYQSTNKKALDQISISIKEQEIMGLLGPNGAGKSTLINIIVGLLKADSGTIQWKGKNINSPKAIKNKLGLVPQEIALYPKLTAYENLDFLGSQYHIPKKLRHKRIEE